MSRFGIVAGARAVVAATCAVLAATSPTAAAGPAVTIYSRDLGFVREERTLVVDRDTVRIDDVSERLDFTSVHLAPESGRVQRLAYRYDVATGDGLLEQARGARVRVLLRDNRSAEGALLVSDGMWIVLREDAGNVQTLSRASVDAVELVRPAGRIATRPSIEAVVTGARGRVQAELSYLTGGLSWAAEHTLVRTGETTGLWSADVTVTNQTGRDYADATLKLVAGEPMRDLRPKFMEMAARNRVAPQAMVGDGGADLAEESFAEYHLYTLPRPATLRDRESQKLTMLETRRVTYAPRYVYRGGDARGVRSQLQLENKDAAGLGVALPAGRVRVYEMDPSDAVQFTGESRIGHTPEGDKLSVDVGYVFDLTAERRETYNRRLSDREREYGVEIELRNRKKSAVTIVVEESVGGDHEVLKRSHDMRRKDAGTIEFTVPVPAGQEVTLSYAVRVRY